MEIKRRQFHRRNGLDRRERRAVSALVDRRTQDRRTREDNFLGARGSTRVSMRVPLQLRINEGTFRDVFMVAWTLVVSKYGAKIECKWPLDVNQEVAVTVLPWEKRSGIGRVVWCDSNLNESGAFELAVEIPDAENLWRIPFSAG